jgi:hypothetical protein
MTRYSLRVGLVLALAAVFVAAVGVHIVHPLFHRHCARCAHDTQCDRISREGCVAATEEHMDDGRDQACPICRFLAFFYGQVCEAGPSLAFHNRVCGSPPLRASDPCEPRECGSHHNRAPPSPFRPLFGANDSAAGIAGFSPREMQGRSK